MIDAPVRVTIGMAVYNGEGTIATALEALLCQTFGAFQLIVSDNASTDATADICKAYASRDPRITYIRQARNIGPDANFEFVLAAARTEYFMWAAADDTKSPDFIDSNLRFLDQHADFVGSTCRVRFVGGDYDEVRMGDATRNEDSPSDRVRLFFCRWHANGRYYSLFRREALVAAKRGIGTFLASDWVVVIRLLGQGKLNRLDTGSVNLGRGGASQAKSFLASRRTRPLHWIFPIAELARETMALSTGEPWLRRIGIVARLALFNAKVVSLPLRVALHAPRRKRDREKC